jgi:phosphohistidine phosphatase SixA
MKTLYLVRHAKSSWGEPALADRDRPTTSAACARATMHIDESMDEVIRLLEQALQQ